MNASVKIKREVTVVLNEDELEVVLAGLRLLQGTKKSDLFVAENNVFLAAHDVDAIAKNICATIDTTPGWHK